MPVEEKGFMRFVRGLFGGVTGRAITEENVTANVTTSGGENASIEVTLSDNATEYVIQYYTDAPTATETNLSNGKLVVISGPDALNYTDVESFAFIPEKYVVGQESRIKMR